MGREQEAGSEQFLGTHGEQDVGPAHISPELSTGDRLRETPEISNRRKENKSIRRAGGKPQVRTLCCGSVVSETGLCWVSRLAQNWMSQPSNSKGGEVTATFSAASMDVKTSSVFK